MSVRCAVCRKSIVSKKGQLCIACQMAQKTAVQSPEVPGQEPLSAQGPYKVEYDNTVQTGMPDMSQPRIEEGHYKGTVHNFRQTENQRSIAWKIWNSLVKGNPLSFSNVQYEFTLYEEGGLGGVRGHKVVMYGDAGYSLLSDGSTVSVRGKSDRNGVVVASEVREISTGFRLRPKNAISASVLRVSMIVLLLLIILGGLMLSAGSGQMAGSAGTAGNAAQEASGTYGSSMLNLLLAVIAGLGGMLFWKSHTRKSKLYALLCILFALGMFSQTFMSLFVFVLVGMVIASAVKKK